MVAVQAEVFVQIESARLGEAQAFVAVQPPHFGISQLGRRTRSQPEYGSGTIAQQGGEETGRLLRYCRCIGEDSNVNPTGHKFLYI